TPCSTKESSPRNPNPKYSSKNRVQNNCPNLHVFFKNQIYHNEMRKNIFGTSSAQPVKYVFDNKTIVEGSSVGPDIAAKIRQRNYKQIDVWLG
ncbi:MAG: hypothetical protein ACYSSP_11430, partial [Planctomycetota bacterium]